MINADNMLKKERKIKQNVIALGQNVNYIYIITFFNFPCVKMLKC
jgi:hypothetical protein